MAVEVGTGKPVRYRPPRPVRYKSGEYPETPDTVNTWSQPVVQWPDEPGRVSSSQTSTFPYSAGQFQTPFGWGQEQASQAVQAGRISIQQPERTRPVTYPRVVQGYPPPEEVEERARLGGRFSAPLGIQWSAGRINPRYVYGAGGAEPPPSTVASTAGTEAWMNRARWAMMTPGAALQVEGTPARKSLLEWQDTLKRMQNKETVELPKSLPPYIAEYLGIPEWFRTQYYEKYPTYTPETGYVWRLKPEYLEKPKTTGQGVDKRIRYWGGGGGGGGWYGGSEPPPWYLGLMNWRI